MFEKKAEEWVKENMDCCRSENCTGKDIPYFDEEERCCAKSAFQDGAVFGYNKANEWHNPKEKLPTKDCEVLIEYDERKTHRVVDWNNRSQRFGGFSIDEVTRWKEIK